MNRDKRAKTHVHGEPQLGEVWALCGLPPWAAYIVRIGEVPTCKTCLRMHAKLVAQAVGVPRSREG